MRPSERAVEVAARDFIAGYGDQCTPWDSPYTTDADREENRAEARRLLEAAYAADEGLAALEAENAQLDKIQREQAERAHAENARLTAQVATLREALEYAVGMGARGNIDHTLCCEALHLVADVAHAALTQRADPKEST